MKKEYIGDSVYAEVLEDGTIRLTTENGYGPTNCIILEWEIWHQLQSYFIRSEAYIIELNQPTKGQPCP